MSTQSTGQRPSTKVCPKCGTRVRSTAAECAFCGYDFSDVQPVAPVVVVHPKRPAPQPANFDTDDDAQMQEADTPDWPPAPTADAPPRSANRSRWVWVAGGVAAVVLVGVGAFLLVPRRQPAPQPSATATVSSAALQITPSAAVMTTEPATETPSPSPSSTLADLTALPPTASVPAVIEPSPTIAPTSTPIATSTATPLQGRVIGNGPTVTMRSGPSTVGKAILQIPVGQSVEVVCQTTGDVPAGFPPTSAKKWYRISSANQQGYIYNRLLNVTGAVPTCR